MSHTSLCSPVSLGPDFLLFVFFDSFFVQYSAAVVSANTRQKKHHLVDLPTVFNEMETLERNRLEITKVRLNKYVTLQEQYYSDRKKITEKLRKIADSVSPANDMQQFTEDTLFEHGVCTYPAPFNYEIACTPSDIEAGRLESINTNSVFHTTLDRCMELQKEKFPQVVHRLVLQANAHHLPHKWHEQRYPCCREYHDYHLHPRRSHHE